MKRSPWILASLVALSLAPAANAGDTYGSDAEIIAEGLYAARMLGPSPEVTTVPAAEQASAMNEGAKAGATAGGIAGTIVSPALVGVAGAIVCVTGTNCQP